MRPLFPDMELCSYQTGSSKIQFLHIFSTGDYCGDVFYYIEGRDDDYCNHWNGTYHCGVICFGRIKVLNRHIPVSKPPPNSLTIRNWDFDDNKPHNFP